MEVSEKVLLRLGSLDNEVFTNLFILPRFQVLLHSTSLLLKEVPKKSTTTYRSSTMEKEIGTGKISSSMLQRALPSMKLPPKFKSSIMLPVSKKLMIGRVIPDLYNFLTLIGSLNLKFIGSKPSSNSVSTMLLTVSLERTQGYGCLQQQSVKIRREVILLRLTTNQIVRERIFQFSVTLKQLRSLSLQTQLQRLLEFISIQETSLITSKLRKKSFFLLERFRVLNSSN